MSNRRNITIQHENPQLKNVDYAEMKILLVKLRTNSSRKVWLLTLSHFTEIHNILEKKRNHNLDGTLPENDHPDLKPSRIKDDLQCFLKVLTWFENSQIKDTDPEKFVSFSTGMICTDETVNTDKFTVVGIRIHLLLDGGDFTSKVSLKLKCKNFDALKKTVRINNKEDVLEPFRLFNRLAVASQRKLAVAESLGHELTVLPASLFDEQQFMRTSKKDK